MILEAFEEYCQKHNIKSEQFKLDIFPAFAGGFVKGRHTGRREMGITPDNKDIQYQYSHRGNPR